MELWAQNHYRQLHDNMWLSVNRSSPISVPAAEAILTEMDEVGHYEHKKASAEAGYLPHRPFQLRLILCFILINMAAKAFAHALLLSKEVSLLFAAISLTASSAIAGMGQPYYQFSASSTNTSGSYEDSWIPTLIAGNTNKMRINSFAGLTVIGPIITIESSMDPFVAAVGSEHEQFYFVKGSGFLAGQTVTLVVSDLVPFTISSATSGYGTTIEITANSEGLIDEMIGVKYAPTEAGPHSATITHSSVGAETKKLNIDGNVSSLPVELVSFEAKVEKDAIILEWITASEKNNSHFDVEIMKNLRAGFEKIGSVDSKKGDSMVAMQYQFAYYLEGAAGTYYFRLKQVDIDDIFTYSKVIVLEISSTAEVKVKVVPNPITVSSQLNITAAETGILNIIISNMNGIEVYSKFYDVDGGENSFMLLLSNTIPAGMYILTAEFKGKFNRLKLIKK